MPLFLEQIKQGGPVTITMKEMTRFLLTLDEAVDTVLAAVRSARPGETYIPQAVSAHVEVVADTLINGRPIEKQYTGIRPGEKIHELMVSEEECYRTVSRDGYYVIRPMLPELQKEVCVPALRHEYSSALVTADAAALAVLLEPFRRQSGSAALPA